MSDKPDAQKALDKAGGDVAKATEALAQQHGTQAADAAMADRLKEGGNR